MVLLHGLKSVHEFGIAVKGALCVCETHIHFETAQEFFFLSGSFGDAEALPASFFAVAFEFRGGDSGRVLVCTLST